MDVLDFLPDLVRIGEVPVVAAAFLPEPERFLVWAFVDSQPFDHVRIHFEQTLLDLVRTRTLDARQERSNLAIRLPTRSDNEMNMLRHHNEAKH